MSRPDAHPHLQGWLRVSELDRATLAIQSRARDARAVAGLGGLLSWLELRRRFVDRIRRMTTFTGIVAVGLVACGGGSDAPPPASGQMFDASYLGYVEGDRRFYRLSGDANFDAEVVERALTVRGVPAVELRDMSGAAVYLAVKAQGVYEVPAEADHGVRSLFGEVPLMRFGPPTRYPEVLFDVTKVINFNNGQEVSEETRGIHVTGWVQGFEDITTALGTFRQVARVRTEVTSTAGAAGRFFVTKVVADEWFAKDVGVVKRLVQASATGSPTVTETYELLAYRVGGLVSDEAAPALVSVVMGTPVPTPLPPPAIGTTYVQTTTVTLDEWLVPTPLLNGPAEVRDAEYGTTYAGQLTVGDDLRTLRFTLEYGLPSDRPLVLLLPDGISDWAGNAMTSRQIPFTRDTRGPQQVSMSPTAAEGDVRAMSVFSVVFNEPVVPTDATAVVVRDAQGAEVVRLPVVADGSVLKATLTEDLPGVGAVYEWSLEGVVLDGSGNETSIGFASARIVTPLGRFASTGPMVHWTRMTASSLADINGDGRPDFVYWASLEGAPTQGRLGVRLGQSDGDFGPDSLLTTTDDESSGWTYRQLRVGDFDGDGRRDVVMVSGGRVRVYLQRADMRFDALPPGFIAGGIAGVIEGVGMPDNLMVIRRTLLTDNVMFERQRLDVGSGAWAGFAAVARDDTFRGRWSIGDPDGDGVTKFAWLQHADDGRTELATAPITSSGFGAVVTRPLQGPVVTTVVTYGSGALALADVNGDAIVDLVHLQYDFGEATHATVWLGTGAGQFSQARTVEVRLAGGGIPDADLDGASATERRVWLGDFDGDGLEDMLFGVEWSGADLALLRQLADGRFVATSGPAMSTDNPVLDLGADGRVDVVGRNRVYRQMRGQ